MKALIVIKRLAAAFLLIAFALPLSQCSLQQSNLSAHSPSTEAQNLPQSVQRNSIPSNDGFTYAYRPDHQGVLLTLANALAFFWPAIFLVILFLRPALEQQLSIRLMELVLCLVSGIFLLRLTGFGAMLFGGYMAWCALGIYASTSLFSFLHRVRRTWNLPLIPNH